MSANRGSITGIYTVLLHEENDPIGELAVYLDGHITLSRELAGRGHYPAIDVLNSISRVAQRVCSAEHSAARRRFTELYARAGATLKNSSRSGHIIRAPIGGPTKRLPITKNSSCSSNRMRHRTECR